MSEQHVDDLLPAYALGSLDNDEELLVSKHLAACESCQQELRAFMNVVDSIPFSLTEVDPPTTLKQKIIDQVETQKADATAPIGPTWQERLRNLFRRTSPVWGLASLALILILGATNLLLWQQVRNLGQQPSTDFLIFMLRGGEDNPQAEGILVLDQEGHTGTLVVDGLDPLDEAFQYQLWLIEGERRTNGGVFSVYNDGYGRLSVSLPKPLSDYTGFGITIEPAGGSPGPTGSKVLGVDL